MREGGSPHHNENQDTGGTPMKRAWSETMGLGQFAWQSTKRQFWATVVSAIVGLLILWRLRVTWQDWVEPLVTMLTLGVAAFVWFSQKREEWEEYLPNRLTVRFYHEDKEVMRCEKAHLTTESDIRALSQQIGAQMTEDPHLKFVIPAVEVSPPELDRHGRYLHYAASFILTELPTTLDPNATLVWKAPFDQPPVAETNGTGH